MNLSRTQALPVAFAKPMNDVEESVLTSAKLTDSNEGSANVSIRQRHLAKLPARYLLPPYSMTTLEWEFR